MTWAATLQPPEAPRPPEASRFEGTVETFDFEAGIGTVLGEDGAVLGFHCTEIADGSRTIDVGATVSFVVGPAGPGVWEAKNLVG